MGSRFEGTIHGDAMPWLNRHVGNPILTGLLNLLFGVKVSDAHCGMRAVRRDALPGARPPLDRDGVRVGDGLQGVPARAARERDPDRLLPARRRVEAEPLRRRVAPRAASCSSTARAGSTSSPARSCSCSGSIGALVLAAGPVDIFGRTWEIHTMLACIVAILVGAQVVQLGCSRGRMRASTSTSATRCIERLHARHSARARPARRLRARSSRGLVMVARHLRRVGGGRLRRARPRDATALGFTLVGARRPGRARLVLPQPADHALRASSRRATSSTAVPVA